MSSRCRPRLTSTLGVLVALVDFSGCQSTPQTTGGQICTYGEVIKCETDAGCQGTQTCLPDLTGYGPCVCGTDAGRTMDAASGGQTTDAASGKDGG